MEIKPISELIKPVAGTKNRVFIKEVLEEKKTQTGIILAEDVEKAPTEGRVVAISDVDDTGAKPELKVGDYVYFPENAPNPITIMGEVYLVTKESAIYGKRIEQ